MNAYLPPESEASFILFDVLKAEAFLAALPELTEQADASLLRQPPTLRLCPMKLPTTSCARSD